MLDDKTTNEAGAAGYYRSHESSTNLAKWIRLSMVRILVHSSGHLDEIDLVGVARHKSAFPIALRLLKQPN